MYNRSHEPMNKTNAKNDSKIFITTTYANLVKFWEQFWKTKPTKKFMGAPILFSPTVLTLFIT